MDRAQLVEELQAFAHTLEVTYGGDRRSWASHAAVDRNHGKGFADEETHVLWARGLVTRRVHLRHVADQKPMPTSLRILHDQHIADKDTLATFVDTYRAHRHDIEEQLTG